jgi:UDP-N-acetylmuramoyl-tripeptide--D-alanyl-D-alanine ligase
MGNNTIEKIYQLYLSQNQQICTDTRKIVKDSIFFALRGSNFDGNQFALNALENGCAYAIVDDPEIASMHPNCILVKNVLQTLQNLANYHRKKLKIPVIAVTGSNGKTTTKELLHAVLSQKFKVLSTPGNFNNHIGLPLTLLQIKQEHQYAIIEMGANHPGEIAELCKIADPDYAIITSIGKEHLEGFGDIETVKNTNAELYDYVLKKENGKIFLHLDNADLLDILEKRNYYSNQIIENQKFILYSDVSDSVSQLLFHYRSPNPIVVGQYLENSDNIFVKFKWIKSPFKFKNILINLIPPPIISAKGETFDFENTNEVKTHLLAYHNFINALCAVCVGNFFGMDEKSINAGIQNYIPDKNRMQWIETSSNKIILDAYNANPTSMLAALEFFKSSKINMPKVLILGDMFELGEHSQKEHSDIIKWIDKNFSKDTLVYLVGKEFLTASKNFNLSNNTKCFLSTQELKTFLNSHPIKGKIILIKASRGMQLEKIMEFL